MTRFLILGSLLLTSAQMASATSTATYSASVTIPAYAAIQSIPGTTIAALGTAQNVAVSVLSNGTPSLTLKDSAGSSTTCKLYLDGLDSETVNIVNLTGATTQAATYSLAAQNVNLPVTAVAASSAPTTGLRAGSYSGSCTVAATAVAG